VDTNHAELRLGTRGSALARWQANWVAAQLERAGVSVELVLVTTQGDVTKGSLGSIGGQGLFTKEIQRALLDHRIDLAVHSLKDLPTEVVPGLMLGAVPVRESNRDALIARSVEALEALPAGSRVGTGSNRRRAQLLHLRPDLEPVDIRGNVDTRLRRLDEGRYDAILLAEAGLKRLGRADRIAQVLPRQQMVPAVGQGALGLEVRADDAGTTERIRALDDRNTHASVVAERALLAALRAGCLAPVGAWARVQAGTLTLDAVVLSADGKQRLVATASGAADTPVAIGQEAARTLLDQGAADLIDAARA